MPAFILVYLSTFPSSQPWPNFTFHLFTEPVSPHPPHLKFLHKLQDSPQVSTITPSLISPHLTSLTSHLTLSPLTNSQAYLISLPTRPTHLISSHPFTSHPRKNKCLLALLPHLLPASIPSRHLIFFSLIFFFSSPSSSYLLLTLSSPHLLPPSLPPPHSKKVPSPRLWEGFRLLIKLPIPAGERKAEAGMRGRG